MDASLEFVRGPLFRFAMLFMLLGLARHFILTVLAIRRALKKAGDKKVPNKTVLKATLGWIFPINRIRQRVIYSIVSMIFHVGLIIVPIFLAGHIALWERGLGFGWPALGATLADALTLVMLVAALMLLIGRVWSRESRSLTRTQDIVLLLLLMVPFASGFLVSHPVYNPFAANATLFVHVLSSDVIMILVPLTKLTHCVLLPTTQLVSEVGWHFPPDAGEKVMAALHPEPTPEPEAEQA